jgi:hypothetical protein
MQLSLARQPECARAERRSAPRRAIKLAKRAAAAVVVVCLAGCMPMLQSDLRKDDALSLVLATPGGGPPPVDSNLSSGSLVQAVPISDAADQRQATYEDAYVLDDYPREFAWQVARTVEFSAADLASNGRLANRLSPTIAAYMQTVRQVSAADVTPPKVLQENVRWQAADGSWRYQFVTLRFSWQVVRSADGQSFQIVKPWLTVYGAAPWVDRRDTSVGFYKINLSILMDYAGAATPVGDYTAAVGEIALEKAGVGPDGRVIPAFDGPVSGPPAQWFNGAGHHYTFHVKISETGS